MANQLDVVRYTQDRIFKEKGSFLCDDATFRAKVDKRLAKKSQGNFLLVKIFLEDVVKAID